MKHDNGFIADTLDKLEAQGTQPTVAVIVIIEALWNAAINYSDSQYKEVIDK